MIILTIRPWKIFAWECVLFFFVAAFAAGLVWLTRLIIFSHWSLVFGVVALFFLFVVYSNVTAKIYLLIQRRIIRLTKTL